MKQNIQETVFKMVRHFNNMHEETMSVSSTASVEVPL